MLDDATLRKVKALVEMTRSDSDNECLMAIRHAHRLCANGKVSLVEALQAGAVVAIDLERMRRAMSDEFERGKAAGIRDAQQSKKTIAPPMGITDLPWKPMRDLCEVHMTLLSNRERDFIRDLAKFSHITTKQYVWLHGIWTRVKVLTPPDTKSPKDL